MKYGIGIYRITMEDGTVIDSFLIEDRFWVAKDLEIKDGYVKNIEKVSSDVEAVRRLRSKTEAIKELNLDIKME